MLVWDLKMQKSYGIAPLYALAMLIFIVVLWVVPMNDISPLLVMMIYTDPVFLGFLFISVLLYFEKSENVLQAMICTPLKPKTYILSKGFSLTIISVYTSVIIALLPYALDNPITWNFIYLVIGVFLSAFAMVLLGFAIGSRLRTFNEYMMVAMVVMLPLMVPILNFTGLTDTYWFYLIPGQATLILIDAAFHTPETWELVYAITYLIVFLIGCYFASLKAYEKYIVQNYQRPTDNLTLRGSPNE
jgi:fluoroquinolone transport system permease protein